MEYQFSRRVQELSPSAIREILKYGADPEVISLSAGNPAPEAFPTRELSEISAQVLAERPIDALQYGTTEGYLPLRQHLTAYLKEKSGIGSENDDLIITSGAQQIMDLFTKSMVDEGTPFCVNLPAFLAH
jgi:2-aminoadipate transaminase